MRKLTAIIIAVITVCNWAEAQVSCTNASFSTLTSYTNGMDNDSLFFICNGETATLLATPPSGTPGWDFVWQQFNVAGNSWNPLTTAAGVPMSQQSNLQPGGYRVIITDGTATIVGTYIVWVCRVNINPTVNVNPIAAGCGNVQLTGQINAGSITPYYNPPSLITDPNSALIVNSETAITVCFSGTHTWISDLGFYLVGPASCGSPTILLSPNPGSNGQGQICNSADNFTSLCFSTESTAIFNPCTPGTYSGTYGGYGVGAGTLINWAALYGCDASQAGWSVQVYDCVSGDTGALTDATITASGNSVGGSPITYTYTTPIGFSSAIADNSCSPTSASIYTVPSAPAVVINFPTTYQWTADPPFDIPNSTSGLNKTLSPGPTVDTQFTLSLTGTHPGAICGGTSSDTELFDYTPPGQANISPVAPSYCSLDDPFNLTADIAGGTWTGTGITSAANGTFSPAVAGVGTHTITYTVPGNCVTPGTITISVSQEAQVNIIAVNPVCDNAETITLSALPGGGTWSGQGITNAVAGTFDPSIAGDGEHTITYSIGGSCPATGTTNIEVTEFTQPSIIAPSDACVNDNAVTLTGSPSGGTWSGTAINNEGVFNPSAAGIGQHSITYNVPGNCEQTDEVIINVIGEITVSIQAVSPLCSNSSAINLSASLPGGTWSGPGITNAGSGTFNPAIAGSGTHTINYVIVGTCPASGSTTIVVNEFEQPIITAPEALCVEANPTTLSATPPGGTWSGDGINGVGVFTPSEAGVGNATVTYSIGGQCPGNASNTIIINPMPTTNVGNNVSICNGDDIELTATGADSYSWTPSTGLSANNVASVTASPSVTTTYTVTGTTNACSFADQIVVTVYPPVNVVVNGPLVICEGDTVQLSMNGLINFNWNNTASLINSTTATPLAFPVIPTTYTVSGTDANGCEGSATIVVDVIDVAFEYTPEEGLAPLIVEFTNLSEGNLFNWDFGNGDTEITNDSEIVLTSIYEEEGTFPVTLSVVNGSTTCSVTHDVFVYADSEITLLPNIVTADGSGKNDNFRVLTKGMNTMSVEIFDRWGKNVGKIGSITDSWNPRDYPDGTYYFTLKAEGLDGKKFEQGGTFTVVR